MKYFSQSQETALRGDCLRIARGGFAIFGESFEVVKGPRHTAFHLEPR